MDSTDKIQSNTGVNNTSGTNESSSSLYDIAWDIAKKNDIKSENAVNLIMLWIARMNPGKNIQSFTKKMPAGQTADLVLPKKDQLFGKDNKTLYKEDPKGSTWINGVPYTLNLNSDFSRNARGVTGNVENTIKKTSGKDEKDRLTFTHTLMNQMEQLQSLAGIILSDINDSVIDELFPSLAPQLNAIVQSRDMAGFQFLYGIFAQRAEKALSIPLEFKLKEDNEQMLVLQRNDNGYTFIKLNKATGEQVTVEAPKDMNEQIVQAKELLEINYTMRQNALNDLKKMDELMQKFDDLKLKPVTMPDFNAISVETMESQPYTFMEQSAILQHVRAAAANGELPIPKLRDYLTLMIYKNDHFGVSMIMSILNDRAKISGSRSARLDQDMASRILQDVDTMVQQGTPVKEIVAKLLSPDTKKYMQTYEDIRATGLYQEKKKAYTPQNGYGSALLKKNELLRSVIQGKDMQLPETEWNSAYSPVSDILLMAETGDTQGLLEMEQYLYLRYEAIKKTHPEATDKLEQCKKNITAFFEITQTYYNAQFPYADAKDIPLKGDYTFEKQNALPPKILMLLNRLLRTPKDALSRTELKKYIAFLQEKDPYLLSKIEMILRQNVVNASRLYSADGKFLYYLQANKEETKYTVKKTDKKNNDVELTQEDLPAVNELKGRFTAAQQLYAEFQEAQK